MMQFEIFNGVIAGNGLNALSAASVEPKQRSAKKNETGLKN